MPIRCVTPSNDVTGTFTPSGLRVAGRISEVSINDATWTALPAVALAGRNAIRIQNQTNTELKINYDNAVPGYTGVWIKSFGESYYDITENITLYAKSFSGTISVIVEELS